jgi:hypothetical protein
MGVDIAAANVNRSYQLTAICIAIFTFMLGFLYPRYASGEVNALLFQATLTLMGLATFSFLFAALHYYGSSLGERIAEASRQTYARRGDRLWLFGTTVLLLVPSVVLASVALFLVAGLWFVLWLGFVLFASRFFPHLQTEARNRS